jgi:hypothetical protein
LFAPSHLQQTLFALLDAENEAVRESIRIALRALEHPPSDS